MKEMPEQFYGLELEYVINGQKSARRDVSVSGTSIYNGRLFTQLKNMPEASGSDVRFIKSSDLKTIVAESTSDVVASVTSDSNYVDTGDEVSVSDLIEKILSRDKTTTDNFTPLMWDSVFWNPSWARPDKIATYLNKALEKNSSDSENFMVTEEAKSSSGKGSIGGSFKIFEAKASGEGSTSKKNKVKKEDVLNVLKEKHGHVEWTGEVFKVKPMKLHRLNLSKLNTSATIAVANLHLHR